jgi:hypothetical protein
LDNESPVKFYHMLCRDRFDHGSIGGAGVGSKENRQNVPGGMAGKQGGESS